MEPCRFCSVLDQTLGLKFVCFSRRKQNNFNISVTDSVDVWTKEFTDSELETFTQKLSLKSADDFCSKLRSVLVRFSVFESRAQFSLVSGSDSVVLDLNKMAAADAKQEVKELLFNMADSLSHSDHNSVSSTKSSNKNLHRRAADFEPRQQNSAPLVTVKKRLPGSSLINPGTKKKREATGVAFDDPDDD